VRYFQDDLATCLAARVQAEAAERAESWPRLVRIITDLARELNEK